MTFVTGQQLQDLRCLTCKQYLSYFPIYQCFDPPGCICGRCSVEENCKRNTIYEEIALIQKFPCCFDKNGCLDHLHPDEIPHHEKFCRFRTFDCPANSPHKCQWKGRINEMWEHFQRYHAIYIIKNNEFQVDLVGIYSENYLLNEEDELYVISQSNSKSNIYSCNVFYIGNNPNTQNYRYKLTLFNVGDRASSFMFNEELEELIDLEKALIVEVLNNPSAVVARIQIVKPEKNEDDFEKVQWDLLSELECSCCFEYLLPPVQQCIAGHSICSDCKPKQTECPTCTKEFKDTVNITLGKVIEHLVYPCRNEGCNFTCKAKNIREHQSKCTFGKFKCPLHDYEDCSENIPYNDLHDHILKQHFENLLELDTVVVPFKTYTDDDDTQTGSEEDENLNEDCFILRYNFRLFKLHYKYDDGMFHWEMQLIGEADDNEKYDFEIDVVDKEGNQRVCFKTACCTLSDKTEAFAEDRSFICIDVDQIDSTINEELQYSVHILPKS